MTDFSVLSFGISDTRAEIPAITGSSVPLSSHLIPLGKAIYEEGGTWARCCRPLLLLNFPPSHTDPINGLQRQGRIPAHWVPRAPAQLRPPGMPRAALLIARLNGHHANRFSHRARHGHFFHVLLCRLQTDPRH